MPTSNRPWLCAVMILSSFSNFGAFAQERVEHGPHAPRLKLKEPRVEVPMDTSTRHPVIELTINDEGPFRFVVDSGAGGTLIDDDLAKKLGLQTIGIAQTGDASGHAPKEMPLVAVERIGIGSARFLDSVAVVGDLDAVWHDQKDGADGVLAFNTFANCLVTFDYPSGKLIIEKGALPSADGNDILAYVEDHHLPTLTLNITGVETPVTLDTGAALTGVLATDLEGRVKTKGAPVAVGKARRMNTTETMSEARINGSVMLGRHEIAEPIVHFMGERSAIGYNIFKHFAITFDQQAKTVRFARSSTAPITIEPRYTAGFGAKPVEGGREVWFVLDGLPAAKAGLKEGDVITTINGRPSGDMDVAPWRAMFEKAGSVKLAVRRGDAQREISFENLLAVE